jgi:hypothetical protein
MYICRREKRSRMQTKTCLCSSSAGKGGAMVMGVPHGEAEIDMLGLKNEEHDGTCCDEGGEG